MTQQNRLAQETSPYLRQHAGNPVDWHPWSEQTLQLARTQNKPILLSIGYSACHWCHVMAHESFDDPDTAELMNRLFINIKVDREERPDLDKIYQLAHLALTQRSGGWPLTMFLSPDQTPFFGGTYFPNTPRHGMPAFKDVLKRVAQYLNDNPQDIAKQNDSLRNFFVTINQDTSEQGELSAELLGHAATELLAQFDPRDGGFGDAPKFPHTSAIEYALIYSCLEDDARNRHMAIYTLERMARGGIYDQLGGGFFRYSVDQSWNIPHFEKMLYDNALLLALYAQASSATHGAILRRCAEETAGWVMREMQAPGGAYYSSLDADSEGVEGKFYLWDKNEIEQLLNPQEYAVCTARYGLENAANFEDAWHLHIDQDYDSIAKRFSHDIAHTETLLASAKAKLFSARQKRPAPGRDEKILCGWNGLMIKAMACAARHLDQPAYLQSAQQAAEFIFQHFYTGGRLYAVHKDGHSKHAAYLDDYAYLLDALFELLQNHWDERYCQYAEQLADSLIRHFQEVQHGGFFFTADDHETLIHRPKSNADDATPAGAAIAAHALLRWGYLLGKPNYLEAAQRCLQAAAAGMQHAPLAHCGALNALIEQRQTPVMFVVRCDLDKANAWRRHFNRRFHLHRYLIIVPNDAQALPAALTTKKAQGELSAYVCRGHSCSAAIHNEHYLKEAFERH